ncbi:MAG: alpha/beta fold hydrolase [Proteobacteria bacterium]|nr:alpha/beta fold hydrolase [Pseudomonadota bacterium]MCP4917227.1 alpha/beta fold hydrolase [Pseudomonadota bacterium]
MLFLISACVGTTDTPTESQPSESEPLGWTAPEAGVVELETRDEVTLVADYYPLDVEGGPAVVLLHMTPAGGWNRTDWPSEFIEALNTGGMTVLNVDRRGSGDSEGRGADAFQGEKGRYDVEAAAVRLRDDGYGDLIIIGASNGTTSLLDYSAWAASESLPVPKAAVFMTGGPYTETQTEMSELPTMPVQFTYSTAERDWSEDQRALDPGTWLFSEYADGDHGTKMFEAEPTVTQDITGFLAGAL